MTNSCDYIEPQENRRGHRSGYYGRRLQIHGEGKPRWVQLCRTCDRREGRRRLITLGWSLDDAIKWEKRPERVPTELGHTDPSR